MTGDMRHLGAGKGIRVDVPELRQIDAPKPLDVQYLPGSGSRLVVSLAGVGRQRGIVPPPELIGSASQQGLNHVLLISDASRSWMNGKGMADAMVAAIRDTATAYGIEEIVAVGNSMGGFNAIVLADLMPIKTVFAISPQFSMHPEVIPEEHRWSVYSDQIKDWRFRDVGAMAQPGTTYFVLHGSHPWEARHWQRFPRIAHHFIFNGIPHDIAARLRKRRMLGPLLDAAMDGKTRRVRKLLQRKTFGRRFDVLRREDFEAEHLAESSAA